MHTPSLSHYVSCLEKGDIEGVGRIMLDSAEKLTRLGADLLICPDNTIHQAFDYVTTQSTAKWLHIAEAVADQAKARGYRHAAILGTKWLMRSQVYPEKLEAVGIEWQCPTEPERDGLDRIIMDELVYGEFRSDSIAFFQNVIGRMKTQSGCDTVILGCTEIPLIIDDKNSPLPTLDSTRLLARAALNDAIIGLRGHGS